MADHVFVVECSDDELLSLLDNYEPFKFPSVIPSSKENAIDVVFVLHIQNAGLIDYSRQKSFAHVYTDCTEKDMPRIEVYKKHDNSSWLMRISQTAESPICCEIESDESFKNAVLHIASEQKDIHFCIDNALMLMYAFSTAPMLTLEMHAAVVIRSKRELAIGKNDAWDGYLFLGHSGTGKSTHARKWLEAFSDAWLLNDDNPILRVMHDGSVWVYGSPWSGKTPCYKPARAQVKGIIKLSQAPHNKIHLLSLPQAYAYILSSASGLKMDSNMADCMYESIKRVLARVKCYHMECLPNIDAAEVCFSGIE